MVDSDSTGPKLAEAAKLKNARDILNGMSYCRIDPTKIKIKEAQTGKRGGQGVVVIGTMSVPEEWKAIVPELKVAVKKLEWKRDDAEESAKFFKSFVNELCLMESLSHPNIIMLVGFVEDMEKREAWMILPWEGNGNVREFLQSGEWDIPERISLIKDTAKGLEYLHSRQPPICHGDLKSFNILVNSYHRAVITDFGSARVQRSLAAEKKDNGSVGPLLCEDAAEGSISPKIQFNPSTMELTLTGPKFSTRWTAPEVLNNGLQDLPSDMWALGWVAWEVVTGKIPFDDLNLESVIITHAFRGKLPDIRKDADLSLVLQLCGLMTDCWLSDPAKRIQASTFQLKVGTMPSATPSGHSAGGQKVRSAKLLFELGQTYKAQGDQVMAEFHFRSSLDVARRTKDSWAMANALSCLGFAHLGQLRFSEAETAFTEAHDIYSRIGGDTGMATVLNGMGAIYLVHSMNQEAEKAFTEAHDISSRIGHELNAAHTLFNLGNMHLAQWMNEEAETAFIEAHSIYSRIGNDRGLVNALLGLGEVYWAQSKSSEAEKAFTEAHEISSHIGHDAGAAGALFGLGNTYYAQSRTTEAEKAYNQAQTVYSRAGKDLGAWEALRSLTLLCNGQCRCGSDHAEASYRLATASYDDAEDGNSRARALIALGQDHHAQRRYPEAEEAVTEAFAIWISINDEECQAGALLLLSLIFKSQSKSDEEKDALIQVKALLARINHHTTQATTLDRLGHTRTAQGTYYEVEECYQLAQAVFSSMDGEATRLLCLGGLYARQGRYDEAEECFADARIASAKIGDVVGEAVALDVLMQVHVVRRKFVDAKAACAEARELYARMELPMSEICKQTGEYVELLQFVETPAGSMLTRGLFQSHVQRPTGLS